MISVDCLTNLVLQVVVAVMVGMVLVVVVMVVMVGMVVVVSLITFKSREPGKLIQADKRDDVFMAICI